MTIVEVLQAKELNVTLVTGSRWLYWDDDENVWVVLERKPYTKKTTILIKTPMESAAVEVLVAD